MKKIVGILICMLLIICGISYSVTAFCSNRNSQSDDEKILTNIDDPLAIRVEAEQIDYRIWLLKAYVKNTWQEEITVKWTLPCNLAVLYIYPGEEDLEILVYNPYHKNIFNFIPSTIIKFEPDEEKLIQKVVFFGISNWILPGLSRGYQKYIPSFPWLPDGDYIFEASINPYFINNGWPQYNEYIVDSVFFHFGA